MFLGIFAYSASYIRASFPCHDKTYQGELVRVNGSENRV